jgi:hypothetical protein
MYTLPNIKTRTTSKAFGIMILLFFANQQIFAHTVVGELEKMSKTSAAVLYLLLGYKHIIPLGFDHILFILSLFLLSPKLKPLLWQATAFTVAHSITLSLTMFQVIFPSPKVIEPLIAISIMFVALENILITKVKATRIGVVFIFGLVHGMGFASALGKMGLPQNDYLLSLVMFNAGVELGQVTIIAAAYFLIGKWVGNKNYYRKYFVVPLSTIIACIAAYWTAQRLFF